MFNNMQLFNSVVYPIANAHTISMYYYAQHLLIIHIGYDLTTIIMYNYNFLGCTYTRKLSGTRL